MFTWSYVMLVCKRILITFGLLSLSTLTFLVAFVRWHWSGHRHFWDLVQGSCFGETFSLDFVEYIYALCCHFQLITSCPSERTASRGTPSTCVLTYSTLWTKVHSQRWQCGINTMNYCTALEVWGND